MEPAPRSVSGGGSFSVVKAGPCRLDGFALAHAGPHRTCIGERQIVWRSSGLDLSGEGSSWCWVSLVSSALIGKDLNACGVPLEGHIRIVICLDEDTVLNKIKLDNLAWTLVTFEEF